MNSRANNASKPQQMVNNAMKKSQGLQKKYQNPKLGANNKNSSSSNNSGGQMKKPDSSGNDDDDELPPELEGLSKELVKRITNDIVDKGAKVTFDDIAGLDHAKKTVVSSVCFCRILLYISHCSYMVLVVLTGGNDYHAHEESKHIYWIEGSPERITVVWASWNWENPNCQSNFS